MDRSHMINHPIKVDDPFFVGAIGFDLHNIIETKDFAITYGYPKLKRGCIFGS
jgi:hypothetical protein